MYSRIRPRRAAPCGGTQSGRMLPPQPITQPLQCSRTRLLMREQKTGSWECRPCTPPHGVAIHDALHPSIRRHVVHILYVHVLGGVTAGLVGVNHGHAFSSLEHEGPSQIHELLEGQQLSWKSLYTQWHARPAGSSYIYIARVRKLAELVRELLERTIPDQAESSPTSISYI